MLEVLFVMYTDQNLEKILFVAFTFFKLKILANRYCIYF